MTRKEPWDEYRLRSKREAARYLGVSVGTLERMMRAGLTYVRISNLVRFRPEDLATYIEQCRVPGAGAGEAR
jgi:excisionase family DNA binding protein